MCRLFLNGTRLLSKGLCSLSSSRISVCIVGSGPAGFYTTEKILKAHQKAEIDIIDRLPTPFGLVRSGVAPDHPETKNPPTIDWFLYLTHGKPNPELRNLPHQPSRLSLLMVFYQKFIHQGHYASVVGLMEMTSKNIIEGVTILEKASIIIKIVTNQFSRVAKSDRCSFFGNISLGSDISLLELRKNYDIVVLSYGAESDRSLGIPGEELNGIYSAREFVWWYNGHPDCFNMVPDLKSTDTAVILGLGNVALDVARILLRPASDLAKTDISDNALASLQDSTIKKVYLVARRGPAQAACTAKELREILSMKNLHIKIQKVDLDITLDDEEEMKSSRIHKRVYELLSKAAASPHCHFPAEQRELHFVFFRRPSEFLPSKTSCAVGAVRLEKTILKENRSSCKRMAIGAGEYEDISCGLVLKSIGYKSIPVDGLPFDYSKGIVPNVKGRVLRSYEGEHEAVEYGLYVSGWLKRGPTGIVATNLYCAEETVGSISEDVGKGLIATDSKPGREGLLQLLQSKNIKHVCINGWEKIDAKEKKQGMQRDRPREKLTTWDELLRTASNE